MSNQDIASKDIVMCYKKDSVQSFLVLVVLFLTPVELIGQEEDLRVMSFNIRYGTARDGDNHWDKRRENVVTTITKFAPDVLGTQEVLPFQADYLSQNLQGYAYVGRSRDTGKNGEQCGILVRSKRFDVLELGHFWLSETPNIPGSKSWDSSLPRMATWVKLFDRKNKSALYAVNTHFDHRGQEARNRSAHVIVDRTSRFEDGVPIILMGDFNTGAGTAPHKWLTGSFVDTFQETHPEAKNVGTFSAFRGKTDGARIDFIFTSPNIRVMEAGIDRTEYDGRNPSDHFPVTSVLQLNSKQDPD